MVQKKFNRTLFLFRRDLRLEDNTGLIFALNHSKEVIPAFIFTPEQIEDNPFKSDHCLKFMLECLEDLEGQLKKREGKLYFFRGKAEEILLQCIETLNIDALVVNRDYTPYSKERDENLEKVCRAKKVAFHAFDDALLHPPETIVKKDGRPYTVFTPYFKQALKHEVAEPVANREINYFQGSIAFVDKPPLQPQVNTSLKGGRKEGLKILKDLSSYSAYSTLRDFPAKDETTHLSPYLKFTVCSPREVIAAIKKNLSEHHPLIRSLHWRDFFTSIAFFFPHVFKGAFHTKFDQLSWSEDKEIFRRWCEGTTGFPIVDAGMREMNETGFMHNRVRMIAASFLIKDLHINWRWGERYFAQTLVDYDPCVNNGNWQWVASTGCDAQPYFRIFNPWRQQKLFDPDAVYIKKWVPELRKLSPKEIHAAFHLGVIDHEKEAKKALAAYKAL